jgi:hypothetical protein
VRLCALMLSAEINNKHVGLLKNKHVALHYSCFVSMEYDIDYLELHNQIYYDEAGLGFLMSCCWSYWV